MKINKQQLVTLIRSCDFLGENVISMWEKRIEEVPERFYAMFYGTFADAKKRINRFYVRVELSRDSGGEYNSLIRDKYANAAKTVSEGGLQNLSNMSFRKK